MHERRGQDAGEHRLVGCDHAGGERRPEPRRDLLGPYLDDAREREQELAVGERVLVGVDAHGRRQQVGRRAARRHAPAAAQARRHVLGAGRLEVAVDHGRDLPRDVRVSERRELSLRVGHAARLDRRQPRRQSFGDLPGVRRHPHARGVDARPPPVLDDRGHHHVDVPLPVGARVRSQHDLAVAGAMHLDARVVQVGLRGRHVAEHHAAPAAAQDLAGAGVVGGVEAEGLLRHAGCHESLDHSVGRPRLLAARLQHQRRAQRDRRHPQRVDAGRVVGQHDSERGRPRDEAHGRALHLAVAPVEQVEVEAAREAADHHRRVAHRRADLVHVLADHDVRQPGRRRELAHVVLGRLRGVPERQRAGREELGRAGRERHELLQGEARERGAHRQLLLLAQVAAHEAGVRLARLHERLARLEINGARPVHRSVGLALAQYRQLQHQ